MDDLGCTSYNKLKGAVSLLRDEAYQLWITVKEVTQADCLTWKFFKTTFQAKYVGASYVDARRREFLNLTQGDRTVAEYEAEFFTIEPLSPQSERDFVALVDKAKIVEDVTRAVCQNNEKSRGKRDAKPSNSFQRFKKKPRAEGPTRVRTPTATTGPWFCANCGKHHQGECWKKMGACLRCRSLEHWVKDCQRRLE
ncbi:uncharacterized protein LOC108475660 [Gossypium arboreum]|uniref:uncharacterized protein LOC108475660 n=1 Tax=Gossypium arboreum TaxID=29729 RepID=UPI0008196122|nr:uncharacterized protein LOC108475660 [Gossypium arboreum]